MTVFFLLRRMRNLFTDEHMAYGVMVEEEKFKQYKISTDTKYNTPKTHIKYAHSVRGRPTLKDVEHFRNGLVCQPFEKSLYKQTFMSEPSARNMLYCYVNAKNY